MRLPSALLTLLVLLAPCPAVHAGATSPQAAVGLQVTDRPHAVRTDAGVTFIYELHLSHAGGMPLRLRRLDVIDDDDGRVLASFTGNELEGRFASVPAGAHEPGRLPGSSGVLYLEWPVSAHRPRVIAHVLSYAVRPDAEASVRGGRTPVSYAEGAPLGPPLRGGPWIAIHHAGWPKGHRRV